MVIVLSMLGKAGSTAVLNLLFVYSAELYPTTLRNMGMGATNLFAGISGMAASYVGNSLVREYRTGLILDLRPANERRCFFVTTSLIGSAQA